MRNLGLTLFCVINHKSQLKLWNSRNVFNCGINIDSLCVLLYVYMIHYIINLKHTGYLFFIINLPFNSKTTIKFLTKIVITINGFLLFNCSTRLSIIISRGYLLISFLINNSCIVDTRLAYFNISL